ncbi:hypothetical protein [Acinetobacter sp.]|uniref:hypothetical protein n=1 Tax=Acinetobacter sp. TaxID=472 RepID=UPI00389116EF
MKIIELYEDELPQDFGSAIGLIQRDCKPFLSQANGGLLYRGMRSAVGEKAVVFSKKTPRTDRKPRNTDIRLHKIMDDWFNEKFGVKARSEAVFCTGDFIDALSYGAAYAIFPIGDFKFIWSEYINDLFIAARRNPSTLLDTLKDANYKTTNLPEAIESDHEIMISCKEYYALCVQSPSDIENIKTNL